MQQTPPHAVPLRSEASLTPPTTERQAAIARPCPAKIPPLPPREIALRTICELNMVYEASTCVVQALAIFDAFARTPEHSLIWVCPDAAACFMVACKFRDVRHPLISDVARIVKVRPLFVRESEIRVLNAIGWRVPTPTVLERVERLLSADSELNRDMHKTAVFLAEFAVSMHPVAERYSDEAMAAGAVACACHLLLGQAVEEASAAQAIRDACVASGFIVPNPFSK